MPALEDTSVSRHRVSASRLRATAALVPWAGRDASVALLFACALALRLVYTWELQDNPFFDAPVVDAKTFLDQALAIARGDLWGGPEPFWQAPGYVYFLAFICWLFPDHYFLAARVAHAILGSLSCVLVYRLADRAFGSRRLALGAGAGAAVYGGFIHFEGELLAVALEIFLYLLLLDRVLQALATQAARSWLVAGLVGGLAAVTRPNVLLFLVLLGPWLARLRPGQDAGACAEPTAAPPARRVGPAAAARTLALAAIPLLAVILAVTARNFLVGGDLVLISANGGVNFHIGNNADSERLVAIHPGMEWEEMVTEPERAGHRLASQRASYFYRKALSYIASQPLDYAALMAAKLYQFWSGPERKRNQDVYYARRHSHLLGWLLWDRGLSFPFGVVGPLAIAGLALTWRRREPALRLLRLFALSYMVSVLLFFVTARYRMPVVPVLLVFAAWTCQQLLERLRGRRYRSFAGLAIGVAGLTVVLNLPAAPVPEDDAQLHFDLGEVYLRKGEYRRSAEHSRAALELTSGDYNTARHNLAVAYFHLGRHDDAVREGLRALEENPRRVDTRVLLGRAYGAANRPDLAQDQFEEALQRMPDSGAARYYYGRLLYGSGRYEEASAHLAAVRAQRPGDFWICYELARCHQHLGQLDEALVLFEAALQIEERAEALNAIGAVHFQRRRLDDARRFFERAVTAEPQNLEAGVNLAVLDLEEGRLREAVQRLEQVTRIHGRSTLALRALIAAYERAGDDVGAAQVRHRLRSLPEPR